MSLKYNEKYILVPEDLVNPQIQEQLGSGSDPIVRQSLHDLDKEMSQVLESKINIDDKLKLYKSLLMRYQDTSKRLETADLIRIKPEPEMPIEKDEILYDLTVTKKNSAEAILKHIQKNPRISYNSRGELVLDSQRVPFTNIKELIADAISTNKNPSDIGPQGYKEFLTALAETKIDPKAIKNSRRRAFAFREPIAAALDGTEPAADPGTGREAEGTRAERRGKRKRSEQTEEEESDSAFLTPNKSIRRKVVKKSSHSTAKRKRVKGLSWDNY
jgi:hypothetical protein